MKNATLFTRQGDVNLHGTVEKLPKGAKPVKHNGFIVLAYGETSGHSHVLKASKASMINVWKDMKDIYVQVEKGSATLTHGKHDAQNNLVDNGHDTFKFEVGPIYVVKIQREEDPYTEELRNVTD